MNYPYAAVEEILSNAVHHRSYQIGEPINVRITPTAMEITSFPGFDRSITDEKNSVKPIWRFVQEKLNDEGIQNTPYEDRKW